MLKNSASTPTLSTTPSPNSPWFGRSTLSKLLCQSLIVLPDSEPSSPSWSPARHLSAIWRPYAGDGLARQVVGVVMDATTHRTQSALVHSLPVSLSRLRGGSAIAIAAESFASSSRPHLCVSPCLRASPSSPRAPPSSPPLGWTRSP